MNKILWYFADPMCSWCWGFSPVITQIVARYRDDLNVSLVVGGLRAGETGPLSTRLRDEILHHWREVARVTGQSFKFAGALPDGFVYDTEPACRAAVTIPTLSVSATFPYFKRLQSAFYTEHRDITQVQVLTDIAVESGLDAEEFRYHWESAEMRDKTRRDFQTTRRLGIRGFPSGVLQDTHGYRLLTHGYQTFPVLSRALDDWLETGDEGGDG